MKKIIAILSFGVLLISACMIYLVVSGISLRAKTLIRPSVMNPDQINLAQGVILRLFPELQSSEIVVWGVKPQTAESEIMFALLKAEFEKDFQMPVNLIADGRAASQEEIRACPKPCWILVGQEEAHHFGEVEFLEQKVKPSQRTYLTVTWVPFQREVEVPEACVSEKRLTLPCLKVLAIHEAKRKMKTPDRHFFMKMHNDQDVFIFVEDAKKNEQGA